jgi:hypothetical protein
MTDRAPYDPVTARSLATLELNALENARLLRLLGGEPLKQGASLTALRFRRRFSSRKTA